jgi:hypothetical protein
LNQAGASYAGYVPIIIACLASAFVIWIVHLTLVRKISIQTRDAWRRLFTEFFGRDRLLLARRCCPYGRFWGWPSLCSKS